MNDLLANLTFRSDCAEEISSAVPDSDKFCLLFRLFSDPDLAKQCPLSGIPCRKVVFPGSMSCQLRNFISVIALTGSRVRNSLEDYMGTVFNSEQTFYMLQDML